MGLMDNIRKLFIGSKNTQSRQTQTNEEYEKSMLADRIIDLVSKIKKINSFDSSVWNLANLSYTQLKRKDLIELQKINSNLENKLSELTNQSKRSNPRKESLEASKWTGQKPKNMSNLDFNRFQKSDDYR